MKKELRDYLNWYVPFKFIWVEDAVPFKKGDTGIMSADDLKYWDEYKKPIFRPISDMNEQECEEYNRLSATMYSINRMHDQIKTNAATTNYLRGLNIDVDSLIEAGLAIDATTLTSNICLGT